MRNFFLALSFLLYHTVCTGQITGSWIKTRVVFSDNTELPEDMELKYSYARYTFERDGNLYISMKYDSKGTAVKYVTDNNVLTTSLKETGMPLNCYKIEEYNDSSLVLLQSGKNGFDGNDCLRLFLTSEKKYTSSFTATMNEIFPLKVPTRFLWPATGYSPDIKEKESFLMYSNRVCRSNNLPTCTFLPLM